jgi:hypothetical protein
VSQPTGNVQYDQAYAQALAARNATYAQWAAPASAPNWNSGITYPAGAFVSSDAVIYKSLTAGNIGNSPVNSPSDWQPMTFPIISAALRIADAQFFQAQISAGIAFGIPPLAAIAGLQAMGLLGPPPN